MLGNLCPPALVYLGFSLVQIIIDIIKNMYNTAILKFVVMLVFTVILNIMCSNGFTMAAWIIVFVPFILMTIIIGLLLYVIGLSPTMGKRNITVVNVDRMNVPDKRKDELVFHID